MTLRNLPVKAFTRPQSYQFDAPADALERWQPLAAEADGKTISIYDVIGEDWWTGEGVTAKRVAGVLRSIGKNAVTVNINSPGGDMFEGLAIYNLLVEHPAEVTVRVMGLAASAASIIAMAGDRVEMGLGSMLMIHNSWGMAVGNQNDMREAANTFAEFDAAMADIYAARTGMKVAEVASLMDAETFMRAESAMEKGFADATFEAPEYDEKDKGVDAKKARARLDATLAKTGMPRVERRALLRDATGTPRAAEEAMPGAGLDVGALARLVSTIKP
jgi:ATP-dependent Clp protease protease subunit